MAESVGKSMGKRGTNQFKRMGHTASNRYGSNPSVQSRGDDTPRELKG